MFCLQIPLSGRGTFVFFFFLKIFFGLLAKFLIANFFVFYICLYVKLTYISFSKIDR